MKQKRLGWRCDHQRRQRSHREHGQALVEAAYGLFFLAAVLVIVVHFLTLWPHLEAVDDAARQGARAAAVQNSLAQGCAAGIDYAQDKLKHTSLRSLAVIVVWTAPQANVYQRGGRISVQVTAQIPLIFGRFPFAYTATATEEIQPGKSAYPRPAQLQCQASF